MTPAEAHWRARAEHVFSDATFVRHLGAELLGLDVGRCIASLAVKKEHLQQDGVVHAGVLTTLADHAAGTAASTLMGPDQRVVSVEFKVHLLRPALPPRLRAEATVLKPGRSLVVVESEIRDSQDRLVAKLLGTMALIGDKAPAE